MDDLRPVEDVAEDLRTRAVPSGHVYLKTLTEILQAEREAVVARDADVAMSVIRASIADSTRNIDATWLFSLCEQVGKAILATAKPPETTRERLGRVLWGYKNRSYAWEEMPLHERETYCDQAEAVQAELAKIQEDT